MFRVDVYQPKEETPSLAPLYACLATASDNGRLLTAGRKNATILLDDKSVSRDHLHLHLMSKHKQHQEALLVKNDGEEETVAAAAAMAPGTQEEEDACDQNSLGMALLVKNLGKFGSAVLSIAPKSSEDGDKDNAAEPKKASGSDDSETDAGGSDTEDESQKKSAPAGVLPVLEGVTWFDKTQKIAQSFSSSSSVTTTMIPKKLGANESFAIPGNALTILIQCGQVGSLVVLTRLDMHFFKSSLPTNESGLWKDRVYALGGDWIEKNFESEMISIKDEDTGLKPTTNLPPTAYMVIGGEREASIKQLLAWQLNIPITSIHMLEALLKRKAPQDPWPKIEDFTPANKSNSGRIDDDNFWDTDCADKSNLWKSCTLVTTIKDKPQECLIRSAGADVVSSSTMKASEFEKRVKELVADPNKKDGLFSLNEKHKSKASKMLKAKGIANVHSKDIVRFICNQSLPQDKDGNVIGKLETKPEPSTTTVEEKKSDDVSRSSDDKPKATAPEEEKHVVPEQEKPAESEPTRKSTRSSPKRKRDDKEAETAAAQDVSKSTSKPSKKPRKDKSNEGKSQRATEAAEVPPDVQEEGNAKETGKDATTDKDEEKPENAETATSKKRSREDEGIKPAAEKRQAQDQNKGGTGKARLEKTEDGWLVAAPKDEARRRAYLKPRDEMLENCSQEKPLEAAPTDFCSGLISRSYDPNRNDRIASMGRKSTGGTDFKKFRKNSIRKVPTRARLAMRSVLPKETERLKQLEEQQRSLEAQQRQADELFHGDLRQSRMKKTTTATRKRRNV